MLVTFEFEFTREVFALSVSLFDRYLSAEIPLPSHKLQLTMATCIMVAQKFEDQNKIDA
jgi:hypothetical protein